MKPQILHRDLLFYPALFVLWVAFMLARYSGHMYFAQPLRSVAFGDGSPGALTRTTQALNASIDELRLSLAEESGSQDRMHIQHNLGIAYYDLYKSGGQQRDMLDSARIYLTQSIATNPKIGRFYYNLGRLFTEYGDHDRAGYYYGRAIEVDPKHVLALHNLGLLTYFEQHKPEQARNYLLRALKQEGMLPMCNYVLGEIALEMKDYKEARYRFENEIAITERLQGSPGTLPTSVSSLNYALSMSHAQLAMLFSTKFVDQKLAQRHYHAYLNLEQDPKRKEEMTARMQKFWVIKK